MSKERFEWLYNETMLKHYMVDNQNNIQLGYEAIVNLLNQQNKQISDLEAKLAESEETINNLEQQCLICNKDKENKQLKQQLAEKEKEKEIEELKHFKITIGTMENNQVDISSTTYTDQDKISFAVNNIDNIRNNIGNYFMTNKLIWTDKIMVGKICNIINEAFDKQIEELKKGL